MAEKVMNCIVFGGGAAITVTLPAASTVDQLRQAIKADKRLPPGSELDLYRAYNATTARWYEGTAGDARAPSALTDRAEMELALANYNVMDPRLQLSSAELNLPEALKKGLFMF
ncbi:hypothetical protein V7S43_014355 [Phytophthora oleae]|uniref:Crinkler effector protein N-terminal domain-containing protein n=1 Tax=Phytophthora oleae TaxID=2107226 RepID=A0ABD3F1B5_9STRA